MKEKSFILYVIYLDKFTEGFVNFFKQENSRFDNKFIIYGKKQQFKFEADCNEILFVGSYKSINKSTVAYKWACDADAIIFSGIFGSEKLFLKFPKSAINKSYLQFWGGDFYDLREKLPFYKIKEKISTAIKIHYIKKVKGIINLISGDYNELNKIVKTNADHFIAPVYGVNKNKNFCSSMFTTDKSENPIKICIGNSATKTNNHFEVFDYLKKYKNENIRIICPLSYGDKNYANEVISYGKNIFGDKFEPLTDYLSREKYFKMLSGCKIGIFNNNRQQAMGNINAFIVMGAKVYIKSDTSMWGTYAHERQYAIYEVEKIPQIDFNEFILTAMVNFIYDDIFNL